jgi:cytoskeletal protein RodZ
MHMKKKAAPKATKKAAPAKKSAPVKKTVVTAPKKAEKKSFLVLLKSWMFVVMFALMLGIGAIVGTFVRQQMDLANPAVAGVSTEAR